jgi:hypothetical protein
MRFIAGRIKDCRVPRKSQYAQGVPGLSPVSPFENAGRPHDARESDAG